MGDGKTLGIAFLGCGYAATIHAKRLKSFPSVRMYFASRERVKAEAFAKKYGGAGAFGSYEEAIGDPRVDAALVLTPPNSHLELTLAALEAGKHAVVEKPPFLHAADFETVRAAKESAGRRVMIAENYFYKPLAEALRETIASGALGTVRIVTVNALKEQRVQDWRGDMALSGGGALYEGGIHWVDFFANLGMEVTGVQAFRPGGDDGTPDRSMVVGFTYANGAVGDALLQLGDAGAAEGGAPLRRLRHGGRGQLREQRHLPDGARAAPFAAQQAGRRGRLRGDVARLRSRADREPRAAVRLRKGPARPGADRGRVRLTRPGPVRPRPQPIDRCP